MLSRIFRPLQNVAAKYFVTACTKAFCFQHKIGYRATHSANMDLRMSEMKIKVIPVLRDNYMYLIIDTATGEAAAIDVCVPEPMLEAVEAERAVLTKVLTTHHHFAHDGGNQKLIDLYGGNIILDVYGCDDRISAINCKITQGDQFKIGALRAQCLLTPCHTAGHICYYIETPNARERAVFTGDTLFQGGCGRFFEGTAKDMYMSMQKLAALPDDTKVFGGHENTVDNLKYARKVEPRNISIKARFEWARHRRFAKEPTIPSTIGEEKIWNPFMRVQEPEVQSHTWQDDPVQVMWALQKERDYLRA